MFRLFVKKWVFLLVIILFNLVIALRTSVKFFYFFFWFLSVAVILNLLWVLLEYLGLKLHLARRVPPKLDEDDILQVEVEVQNNSFLPGFNLVLEDYLSCATPAIRKKRVLLEYLGPRASLNLRYFCRCPQRGRYLLGPFFIYIFDPWGLFFLKKTFFVYCELYVYPRTFKINKFPSLVKGVMPWFGIETTRASGDDDEFFGVREYREMDPLKIIHWFSTARKNRIIVKQFQRQSFFRATIIFNLEKDRNLGEGKECVAEYIIKIAASVAKYLIERNVAVEVIAHIGEVVHIPFNKGLEHLEDILRFLTIAQAESRVNLGELFQEFSHYIPNDSSLIAIMLDRDWEYLPLLLSLKNKNVSVVPVILAAESFLYPSLSQEDKGAQMIAQSLQLSPILLSRGDNLEEAFLRLRY